MYDGTRILKYKIATTIVWWPTTQPQLHNGTATTPSSGDKPESGAIGEITVVSGNGNGLEKEKVTKGATDDTTSFPPFTKPLYKSVVKIRYNNLWYTSVENVVAAIEAQFNLANSPYQPSVVELKPVHRGPKVC